MREEIRVSCVIKVAAAVLVLNNAHGDPRRWYQQLRPNDVNNYETFDDRSPMRHNGRIETPKSAPLLWILNPPTSPKSSIYRTTDADEKSPNSIDIRDIFVFPDDTDKKPEDTGIEENLDDGAPPCEGETFCEEVPGYPTELVNELIRRHEHLYNYENIDLSDSVKMTRIDVSEEQPLCMSMERVVYPQLAQDVNEEWFTILNTSNFTQGVRIETCTNPGKRCGIISDFISNYATTCEQKYVYRELKAVEGDSVANKFFRFPTSCCCRVDFVDDSGNGMKRATSIAARSKKKDLRTD